MLGRQQGVGSMQRGSLHKAPAWLSRPLQHPLHLLDFMEEPPLVCPLTAPWNLHLPRPLFGGTNETPATPLNRFFFCSTVLALKVSRCSRSPTSRLPTVPSLTSHLPLVPGSVQFREMSFTSALCSLSSSFFHSELLETSCSR